MRRSGLDAVPLQSAVTLARAGLKSKRVCLACFQVGQGTAISIHAGNKLENPATAFYCNRRSCTLRFLSSHLDVLKRAISRLCASFSSEMPEYTQEQAVALLQKVDSADGSSVFDHFARVILRVRCKAFQLLFQVTLHALTIKWAYSSWKNSPSATPWTCWRRHCW